MPQKRREEVQPIGCRRLWLAGVWTLCLTVSLSAEPRQGVPIPDSGQGASPASPAAPAPITVTERVQWFAGSTIGPKSLFAGVLSAGWGTARNRPPEYGSQWEGFGKRFGMRLTGVSTGNAIEGGLGAAWGEDPRYFRAGPGSAWSRIRHAAKLSVVARRSDGSTAPSYARYAGIVGNNFLSNSWRVPSEGSTSDALTRSSIGIAGKFVSNLFEEFWPGLRPGTRTGD